MSGTTTRTLFNDRCSDYLVMALVSMYLLLRVRAMRLTETQRPTITFCFYTRVSTQGYSKKITH